MAYNTFPLASSSGAAWDIKKRIITSSAIEEASNGAEFITSKYSKVHYEFDLSWNYLSQADKDILEDFIAAQLGPYLPFWLLVSNDNTLTNAFCGTGNGSNKVFQIPLRAQAGVSSTTSLTDNGVAAGANTIDINGLITFTTAPLAGHPIRWTGVYAYLVRFKDDVQEINQLMYQMYEQGGITFRTRR